MLAARPLVDKREGPCKSGPCRMPRRCQQQDTCFLYSTPDKQESCRESDGSRRFGYLCA